MTAGPEGCCAAAGACEDGGRGGVGASAGACKESAGACQCGGAVEVRAPLLVESIFFHDSR